MTRTLSPISKRILCFLFFLLAATVLVNLSSVFGETFRSVALSHDPSLAAAPVETLWGLLSFPLEAVLPDTISGSAGFEGGFNTLFPIIVALFYWQVMRRIRGDGSEFRILIWALALPVSVAAVSIFTGTKDFLAGPEVLAAGFLILPYLLIAHPDEVAAPGYRVPLDRAALALGALAGGLGALPLGLVLPPMREAASRVPKREWKFYLLFLIFPSLVFAIQRTRYPNPDLPPLGNIWSEIAGAWLLGKSILDLSFGGSSDFFLFRFPGLKLGLAWFLSLGLVRLCSFVWRMGAGRTVPAQVALYLLPILYLATLYGVYRSGGERETEENPLSLEERLNYARALHEKLPTETILNGPRELYDAMVYLRACEGVRNRIDMEPGGEIFWTNTTMDSSSTRPPFSRTPVAYSQGKNWLGIAGERLEFAPQHLLGATEVYRAVPTFFVGSSPPPILAFEGKPFLPKDYPAPDLTNWGFDGEHFYLFRERLDPIWRPLGEGWEVHYFGFLLAEDLKRWNRPLPRLRRRGFGDFYH